jgi:hypothetical protein
MWIRFWATDSGQTPEPSENDIYRWVSDRETDDSLKEWARELIPEWFKDSDRSFRYGFERLNTLPQPVRERLYKYHAQQMNHHQQMLALLRSDEEVT